MIRLTRVLLAVLIALTALAAGAQTAPTSTLPPAPAEPPAAPEPPPNSHQTRDELRGILQSYPPEVSRILRLDPTLLRNESWMATYPALSAFVAAHPEISHSPAFFFEGIGDRIDTRPESATERIWREAIDMGGMVLTFFLFLGSIVWAVRTIGEHKRWNRLSKQQMDVHTKLMDRLTSNDELLAYMQSPAGKKFLESAPIQLDTAPRSVSAPIGRILWSVQIGLVMAAAGLGLLVISSNVTAEVAPPLWGLGVLAIATGAGFAFSALVSFTLSRRFGLLEDRNAAVQAGE